MATQVEEIEVQQRPLELYQALVGLGTLVLPLKFEKAKKPCIYGYTERHDEGKPTPMKFLFRMENGKWRLDLTSIMPAADQAFKQVIRESGLHEDKFLITIIESVSG